MKVYATTLALTCLGSLGSMTINKNDYICCQAVHEAKISEATVAVTAIFCK